MSEYKGFPPEIEKDLEFYVYRLIDPRNGETFYVGKGTGNRVFDHVNLKIENPDDDDEENYDDELSRKEERIKEIHKAKLKVITVIHRYGMNEATAQHVASALIDAYMGLAETQSGFESDYGPMHTDEIMRLYSAAVANFSNIKNSLIIKIKQTTVNKNNGNVYKAVRSEWRLKKSLLNNNTVKYVFAVVNGIIKGVYEVSQWDDAGDNRICFTGTKASIWKKFIRQRIPDNYREKGAANPCRYIK